ncbi:MAG: monomethylamine:corrinoid methyltransferase [Candidatus Bathyarchaeia archaeon]
MISLLDVAERARSGRKMDNKEWGLALFKKLQELIIKHELKQEGPEQFYELDNEYADALFQAAVHLLGELGVYCTHTHRTITFSEYEVREALREIPSEQKIGEGPDQRVWRQREIEDSSPPGINVGGHGPWSDELIPLPIVVRELVRNKRVDTIEGYMYARIDGREVHNKASRAYAARRAVAKVREGLAMAGRSGLAITYYPVLTDAFSMLVPFDAERGLRKSDGGFFTILPDLMVEEELIGAALVYNDLGCYGLSGGSGAGPWGGAVEGRMIESTVGCLTNWLVYRDTLIEGGGASAGRGVPRSSKAEAVGVQMARNRPEGMKWQSFAVHKALMRNTNQIYYRWLFGGNRRYWDMTSEPYLLRVALSSMRSTLIGLNFRVGDTNPPTYTNWVIETSDAVIKSNIGLEDFVELSKRVFKEKLEDHPIKAVRQDQRMHVYGKNPSAFLAAGLKAYDWYKQKPTDEYVKGERKARNYLRDIGLTI